PPVAPDPTTTASYGSRGETIWSIHRKYTAKGRQTPVVDSGYGCGDADQRRRILQNELRGSDAGVRRRGTGGEKCAEQVPQQRTRAACFRLSGGAAATPTLSSSGAASSRSPGEIPDCRPGGLPAGAGR